MKYLIMETHPAYAVLLDENGRFLKAANLNYHVGETVQDIIELKSLDKQARRPLIRQVMAMAAAAACFCLVFFGYYQPNYMAYGTIFIRINPEVEMTVSRTERVLELDGRNADGDQLISGYDYSGKSREIVPPDLIHRVETKRRGRRAYTNGGRVRDAGRNLYWQRGTGGSDERRRADPDRDTGGSGKSRERCVGGAGGTDPVRIADSSGNG